MRRSGEIPYGWIADSTRWMRKPRSYTSLADMLRVTTETYRRALWDDQDAYVEVWCRAPDGTVAPYERVDAHSVDQGNKDVQVEHFGLHHDGWLCQIGPFA